MFDSRLPRRSLRSKLLATKVRSAARKVDALSASLSQASIPLEADEVIAAARGAALLSALASVLPACVLLVYGSTTVIASSVVMIIAMPIVTREAVLSYVKAAASRRGALVARSATECVSLMIMSIRHESSLSRAMAFAARHGNEFAEELRAAIWSVMTDMHSTFDEALQAVGARWGDAIPELKSSLQSIMTASCEATDAGKRRALDRANRAIVAGARRRIEQYALSLSVPSMLLFGVGIILPLMVGSFLPLLSWNIWTDPSSQPTAEALGAFDGTAQVVLLMNIVFPAIAFLVAADAISRHPFSAYDTGNERLEGSRTGAYVACACIASAGSLAASMALLEGTDRYIACLLSATIPAAVLLTVHGARAAESSHAASADSTGDMLFSMGSRMVEGENFESAWAKAMAEAKRSTLRDLFDVRSNADATGSPPEATTGALEMVRHAAAKDEAQSGILAMDLSSYLKEVAELEATMRRHLKPTMSMMRITTHVLAPVVLGITYAIYLSLASIGQGEAVLAGPFLVILGVFLAEMNAVVAYFVWGIGETRRRGELAHTTGMCTLVAMLIYSATVVAAA